MYFTPIGRKLAAKFPDGNEFIRYLDDWSESVEFPFREISLDQSEKIIRSLNNSASWFR